jgi:hypothetical protein
MGGLGEGHDMHAPFIFASVQRAGAVDHDFPLPQRQRPAVQQAAAAEFLPGAGMAGHDAEQHQWRCAAHDPVELLPDFGRIRRLQRRNA